MVARSEIEATGLRQLDELLTKAQQDGYYGEVGVKFKFVNGIPRFLEVINVRTIHVEPPAKRASN